MVEKNSHCICVAPADFGFSVFRFDLRYSSSLPLAIQNPRHLADSRTLGRDDEETGLVKCDLVGYSSADGTDGTLKDSWERSLDVYMVDGNDKAV